jgi:uncharacterized protein with GYD domain
MEGEEEGAMPLYLTQFSYNKEALAALSRNPQRLSGRLVHAVEHSLGGRILSLVFCFGFAEWDGIVLFEASDPTRATAILMAALSASHIERSRTVPLLTVEEFAEALRQASGVVYEGPPPSG